MSDLIVNLDSLGTYSTVTGAQLGDAADLSKPLVDMAIPRDQAFTSLKYGDYLAEGAVAAQAVKDRISAVEALISDVTNGLRYLSSAAAVIKASYNNTDVQSAQDISVVSYAFGDKNAAVPAGIPEGPKTFSQLAQENAANGTAMPQSTVGDPSNVLSTVQAGNVAITTYKDGSTTTVSTIANTPVQGVTGYGSKTVTYDAAGAVMVTTTRVQGTDASGRDTVLSITQQSNGNIESSKTVTQPDGDVEITNTTEYHGQGATAAGRSEGASDSEFHVEYRPTNAAPEELPPGPVERAQDALFASGS